MVIRSIMLLLVTLAAVMDRFSCIRLYGAGASFPSEVYQAWIPAYRVHRSDFVSLDMKYDSVGSGDGKVRIMGGKGPAVDYAGSDSLLTEADYKMYPDLQMFPTMAGAIVLAYNIPGIQNIHLRLEHVVCIFNGSITWWDDPLLITVNPMLKLPHQRIRVVVRSDKSGSMEIFTRFLSSVSSEWEAEPGFFSAGLGNDGKPEAWNSSVVEFYGQRTRGMTGLILSIRYTIGYTVHAGAFHSRLNTIILVKNANKTILMNVETVQNAMKDFRHNLSINNMALNIVNPPGTNSYPISTYTYFIVKMTTIDNCDTAIELVRYIQWFLTATESRDECVNQHMVPLSDVIVQEFIDNVLKKVMCHGSNVYAMMTEKIKEEQLSLETWRMPIYVAVPLLIVVFSVLLGYIIRDQIKIHKALLRNDWRISKEEFCEIEQSKTNMPNTLSQSKSRASLSSDSFVASDSNEVVIARRGDKKVRLTPLKKLSNTVRFMMKKHIMWMRNSVHHDNVVLFFGLTNYDNGMFYSVCEVDFRFTLRGLLNTYKDSLSEWTQFAISCDIAKGMNYLHKKSIIHGGLRSTNCFVDFGWKIRIGNWMEENLVRCQRNNAVHMLKATEFINEGFASIETFWVAPEILKFDRRPTQASDVYSYAIVLQEFFSYKQPYVELFGLRTHTEIIRGIVAYSLRPSFKDGTPCCIKDLMERAWDMDPASRPTFTYILDTFKHSPQKAYSVMDCMMEALEKKITDVESKINKQGVELQTEKDKCNRYLSGLVPLHIARKLDYGLDVKPELFDNLTVMVLAIDNIETIAHEITPLGVTDTLNVVHRALSNIFSQTGVCCVDKSSDYYIVASGICAPSDNHTKSMAKTALACLDFCSSFQIDEKYGLCLRLRIGLSSGRAVAGILGDTWRRYFLVGSAPMTARILSNHACWNSIRISVQTSFLLKSHPQFIVQEIACKENSNESDGSSSYWLVGRKDRDKRYYPIVSDSK